MKTRVFFFLVTSFLLLYGCNRTDHDVYSFTRDDFPETFILKDPIEIKLNLLDTISEPTAFWIIRDSLIVVQHNIHDKSMVDFYSLKDNNFLFHAAPRGRGPGEFVYATFDVNYNDKNTFFLDDEFNRYIIDVDSSLIEKKSHILKSFSYYRENNHMRIPVIMLDENEFIGYNLWYIDDDGYTNKIPPLTKYTINDNRLTDSEEENNFKYFPGPVNGAHIFANPKNGEIWATDFHRDEICIYDSSLSLIKKLSGPDHFSTRIVSIEDEELTMLIFAEEQIFRTYSGYYLTDDYVYVIYHGIIGIDYEEFQLMDPSPSEIFKFTWDGKLVANYKLDRYTGTISITENGQYLYITSWETNDSGPVLYRYQL